ncbi:hypothetical protein BU17DRAFT_103652 [Hysterangium stoloniferum]|nr:hypothetical protein BU17DRAFT_103652 [Hysterangium stoloniferum]
MAYHPPNSPFSPTRNPDNSSAIQTFCNPLSVYAGHYGDEYFVSSIHTSSRVFLIVERTPGRASPFNTVRTASSKNFVAAADTIISLDQPTFTETIRTRSASQLYRLVFDPSPGRNTCPAVDVSLAIVFWNVMEMVEECFTVAQTEGNRSDIIPGEAKKDDPSHPKRFSDRKAGMANEIVSLFREEGLLRVAGPSIPRSQVSV